MTKDLNNVVTTKFGIFQNDMVGTPIYRLFELGFSTQRIAEITKVTTGGAAKWSSGRNIARRPAQTLAADYIRNMPLMVPAIPAKIESHTLPHSPAEFKFAEPEKEIIYMVSVPERDQARFIKMMNFINMNYLNMDE